MPNGMSPRFIVTLLSLSAASVFVQTKSWAEGYKPATSISESDGFWEINSKPTYEGAPAEGLLIGSRMVNATFNDRNPSTCPKGFDPDKNTEAFLKSLPSYLSSGVNTILLNLQGGNPGYQGALNSAFNPDGSLRQDDLARISRVIEACDKGGAVVVLGFFSPGQDQVLKDEGAVKAATKNACEWIRKRGYTNVLAQVAEEHSSKKYDHEIIATGPGCASLIRIARAAHPGLKVSASGLPNGRVANEVGDEGNVLFPRFNSTPLERINLMVVKLAKRSKPIFCVDDSKSGAEGAQALEICVRSLCSWAYSSPAKNQRHPFTYRGPADDPVVYSGIKKLTGK